MKELKDVGQERKHCVVKPPATDKPTDTCTMDVRVETRSAPLGSSAITLVVEGSGPGTSRSARKKSPRKRRSMDEEGGDMESDQFYQESDS